MYSMSHRSGSVQRDKEKALKMGPCRTSMEEGRTRRKKIWKDWRRAKKIEVSAVKDSESPERGLISCIQCY